MRSERVKSFKRCFQSPEIFHAIEKVDLPDFRPRFHENHLTIGLDNIYHVPKEKSYFSLFPPFLFPLWVAFTIPRNENDSKTSISRDVATDAQCRGGETGLKRMESSCGASIGKRCCIRYEFHFCFRCKPAE